MSSSTSRQPGPAADAVPARAATAILALGFAESLLALFQWMELAVLEAGGEAICSINTTVDCARVWSSGFAQSIGAWTGLPVAGWGLVWGVAVVGQGLWLVHRRLRGETTAAVEHAVRLTAVAGGLAVVVLAIASASAGALCPTCLATYALVGALGYVTLRWLRAPVRPPLALGRRAIAIAFAAVALPFIAAFGAASLAPALQTGGDDAAALPAPAQASSSPSSIDELLASLDARSLQAVSDSLAIYRGAPRINTQPYPVRHLIGPADAPVRIVEWTDIRCGHCRRLVEVMEWLEQTVPMERWALETRHFPLDATCNPYIRQPDPTGVRCLAARAQICLEPAPDFQQLRKQMFAEQESLTPERVLAIAGSGSVSPEQLRQCIDSEQTAQRLVEDVHYAGEYRPDGTPIVAVNGRKATSVPPFLLLLILLEGADDHPALANLPPPNHNAHIH